MHRLGGDASVAAIDFFHLIDDRDLVHYQSGLLRGRTFIRGRDRIPVSFNGRLAPGTYVVAVRMTAWMNSRRATTAVTAPFTV